MAEVAAEGNASIDHLRHAHFHNLKIFLLGGVRVLHYQVNVHSISESLVLSGSHLFWGGDALFQVKHYVAPKCDNPLSLICWPTP